MMLNESSALMRVWHSEGLDLKGPTLNSLLGMVRSKDWPDCDVNVNEITAGRLETWLQGIPKVPGSAELALILGEIIA